MMENGMLQPPAEEGRVDMSTETPGIVDKETSHEETHHEETHDPPNPTDVSTTGADLPPPRHGAVQVAQVRWR